MNLAFNLGNEIEFQNIIKKIASMIESHAQKEGLSNSVLVVSIEKIIQETELENALISEQQL